MAEMRASPVVNPRLLSIAKVLQDLQGPMGQVIPGTDVNPFKLLPAAQSVENWAYGNSPFSDYPSVTNRRLPVVKTGREREVGDLADTALMAAGIPAASRGVTKGANFLGDVLTQIVTRNPEATAVKVLEEAGNLVPLNRIFVPAKDPTLVGMAEAMEARGMNETRIHNKTGLARTPIGREWVQETDDSLSTIDPSALPVEEAKQYRKDWLDVRDRRIQDQGFFDVDSAPPDVVSAANSYANAMMGRVPSVRLMDVFRSPDLEGAEPYLMATTRITPELRSGNVGGSYRVNDQMVTVRPQGEMQGGYLSATPVTPEDMKSVITHELQHGVQFKYGHGLGGNPGMARQQLEMAMNRDPAFSPANTQANYDWKMAWKQKGLASKGEYLNQLKDYSQRNGLRPRAIEGMADWYQYNNEYRQIAGPRPKKPGPARDQWLKGAANFMLEKNLQKEPWNAGLMEEFDKRTARNAQARADRVIKKNEAAARQFQEASARYNRIKEIGSGENADYELYKRLEGEAMSRLAQTRMNLTAAERRENFPFHSQYDMTVRGPDGRSVKQTMNPYGLDVPADQLFVYRENYNR